VPKNPTIPDNDPTLANMVMEGRQETAQTIRELSRRSAVQASQISRIEAGEILSPAEDALRRIAHGIGRPAEPLLYMARHLTEDAFVEWGQVYVGAFDLVGAARSLVSGQIAEGRLPEAALAAWRGSDFSGLAEPFVVNLGRDGANAVERFAEVWFALTAIRRELVIAFLEDQARLSEDDRLHHDGNHPVLKSRVTR
jgi:transcriptional regulator with XRE-family HTH domain